MGLLVKRRVTLDLARRGTQATVPFSLGDRCAYEVIFTLRDGSEQVALPPGTSAAVTVRNGAGGTGCVDGCVIDHVNNNVIYTPTVDALSVEGNIECTLHLFDGDGGVIGAPTFIFAVSEGDKADTEGEVSKALVANPGWGIIADTENKAKEAAEAAAAANNFASQASDEVAAAQVAAGEARAEADRAHDEAELSKMWANGGITLDEPPSEINNSYYWAMMSATERISAETQVGLAAAEVNNARTEVQNAAAEVKKAKAEAQTAEAEAIKARMWAVGEKSTPGKTSPSDSNNAMYYSNKSRDYMNEAEKYTNMTLSLSVDREKHIYTVSLIRDGTVIGNPIEIDLPFEEVVVGGEYDDTSEELVLKLKGGTSVAIPVGDIISPDDVVRRQYSGSYDAVYTETSSGEVVLLPVKVYSGDGAANTLVKRGSLGEIRVRSTPEFDDEAASKRHVDEVADALGKGLEDLKEWVTQNQPAPVEIVQNLGDSSTAVISQKGVTDAIDGLALKGSASGKVIRVDDVAPGEYPVKVKVSGVDDPSSVTVYRGGKNLVNIADFTVAGSNTWTSKHVGDFLLPSGTYTLSVDYIQKSDLAPIALSIRKYKDAGTYYKDDGATAKSGSFVTTFTIPEGENGFTLYAYSNESGAALNTECLFSNAQVEEGSNATEYEPYIEVTTHTPSTDGTVAGVLSCYPTMVLLVDNTHAILDVEYSKDITEAIDAIVVPLTPEMFGAVGDGVADDTEALQTAINAATASKRKLLFTKTYNITTQLKANGDFHLEGDEVNRPTISTTADIDAILYLGETSGGLVNISNINFECNEKCDGIKFGSNRFIYSKLDNVRFLNAHSCIRLYNDGSTTLKKFYAHNISWTRIRNYNCASVISQTTVNGGSIPWVYGGIIHDVDFEGYHIAPTENEKYVMDLTGFYNLKISNVIFEGQAHANSNYDGMVYITQACEINHFYYEIVGGATHFSNSFVINSDENVSIKNIYGYNIIPILVKQPVIVKISILSSNKAFKLLDAASVGTLDVEYLRFGSFDSGVQADNALPSNIKYSELFKGDATILVDDTQPIYSVDFEKFVANPTYLGALFSYAVRDGIQPKFTLVDDPVYGKCLQLSKESKNLTHTFFKFDLSSLNIKKFTIVVTIKVDSENIAQLDSFIRSEKSLVFYDGADRASEYRTEFGIYQKDDGLGFIHFDYIDDISTDANYSKQTYTIADISVFKGWHYGACKSKLNTENY